jgi:hypothetical protein
MTEKNTDAPDAAAGDPKSAADHAAERHDQLTTAPKSTEADAAPRLDVTEKADGTKRIDWRDDAQFRPGKGSDEA